MLSTILDKFESSKTTCIIEYVVIIDDVINVQHTLIGIDFVRKIIFV